MSSGSHKYPAAWWKTAPAGAVDCLLCPRNCRIKPGCYGACSVRCNEQGKLYSTAYGYPVAMHVDPIEKKPLANFLPGTATFSFGTFGCNLFCSFCQNASLSRGNYNTHHEFEYYPPETLVDLAFKHNCKSIAFTYNEPTVFGEYMFDTAQIAKERGLATVMVSNGFITQNAARDIYTLIDAANIDMKGFSEEFYVKMTKAHLQPVLDSIKYLFELGKHIELTNLVIPGYNDADEMVNDYLDWVEKELNKDVTLHFSAYHPDYMFKKAPATPRDTLFKIRDHAESRGFTSIQLGNISLH